MIDSKGGEDVRMTQNRQLVFWLVLFVVLLTIAFLLVPYAKAGNDKPDVVSYYQSPPSQVLQPGTIWNPVITENRKDNRVYKSYYAAPPSPTLPAGSIWNPLLTEDAGKLKK